MKPGSKKAQDVNQTMGPLDTHLTPAPGGPIPIPYANMVDSLAQSGDRAAKRTQRKIISSATKKGLKASSATAVAIASQGDVSGTQKGLVSPKTTGSSYYKPYSSNVKVEGKNVVRHSDVGMANSNNPQGFAGAPAPSQTKRIIMGEEDDQAN